ncbi:ABC transporter ATP-binding protein [Methylocella sp. CPCC 101449]|uniref:ABC transporter ATP-binding protein n=1 Tax=Methylocella sp. CPCC 101449 TaxID=2987531 RepID=UPI00288E235C|nr:ABC transporter ATP-binding protein [Methylocella sp. CPCC 101449]MDT2019525.1 ABC transporter ATP-binding protein [Methylocella sp. CPCC 101449]
MSTSLMTSDPTSIAPYDAAPAITVRNVSKWFRRSKADEGVHALNNISLNIKPNSFVSLVGPSGCGKTTLLRMLNGLIRQDSGEILVGDTPPVPGPHMGIVFQSFRLMPWRTIKANVYFPLELHAASTKECEERADYYLNMMGLRRFADSYPRELSGGMQQRAALARALIAKPAFLLMDEPFAALDAQTREFMQIEVMKIRQTLKSVVIFVTHSVDEAVLLSDQVVMMRPRPGQISEIVDVNLPQPRWEYDARATPEFVALRRHLWEGIKTMVLNDPQSEFYQRDRAASPSASAD